ncbi:hypothetical protein PCANB_000598 [Pneumocystis canis]|nr:hypothetical protein PCANB_000598 [Pneumocystis canis]
MSFERTNLVEYQERSIWNLFKRKHLKRKELSRKTSVSSLKCATEDNNPPNPVIRPLLVRPQARDESSFLFKEKIKQSVQDIYTNTSEPNTFKNNTRNTLTYNEAHDDEYIKWKNFIFAYAQNAYDLSNPPLPPTKLKTRYFVPPRPFNETERLAVISPEFNDNIRKSRYSSLSSRSDCKNKEIERLQRLVVAAVDFFSTSIAAVSLIDGNRCYFKCEIGLNMSDIDRDITFCTHTLLRNPLVTDPPYLRFYAGAPIITPDGYPIGTISVIDSNARLFFSPQDIRRLFQFACMAMDEIEHFSRISKNRNPSLEDSIQKISLKSSNGFSEVDSGSTINEYQVTLNGRDSVSSCTQNSVHESIFQDLDESLKAELDYNIWKNAHPYFSGEEYDFRNSSTFPMEISPDSKVNEKNHVIKDSCKFNTLQPSSLSQMKFDSEKSKLYPSLMHNDKTISSHISNIKENETYNNNENNYMELKQALLDMDKKKPSQELKTSELTPPSTPVNTKTNFSNSIDKNILSKKSSKANLQIYSSNVSQPSVFATHVIACTLGLDLVYIVQISPDNCASLESQNKNKSSTVSLDIIASCGLPYPPPVLDPVLHLRALRSESGLIYRNPFNLNDDCSDYKVGILVPLWRDDIDESNTEKSLKDLLARSSSGVVLAGFSKKAYFLLAEEFD